MAFLEIKNIKKSFGKTEVLKGIDLEMEKGEVLAIIGSSGSGKTTLLRCINFLEIPDEGKIVVNGETVFEKTASEEELYLGVFRANLEEKYKGAPEKKREAIVKRELKREKKRLKAQKNAEKRSEIKENSLKKAEKGFENDEKKAENTQKRRKNRDELREKRLHFGLVFQQFNLFPHLSVLKNVTIAAEMLCADKNSPTFGESKESIENRAKALLEKVGLSEKAKSYPCELSGGQQQRVAIARALALDPDVLCFDEPTSALDPELTGEVLKVIKGLKSGDSTMIIVTHEMEFAKNVADKAIFMANGVVEEYGDAKKMFENPKSEKLKAFLSTSRAGLAGEDF